MRVSRIYRHPKHEKFENDLAILQLETPITFSEYVKPICLPKKGNPFLNVKKEEIWNQFLGASYDDGQIAKTLGWGKLHAKNDTDPRELQQINIMTWTAKHCRKSSSYPKGAIKDYMICAGMPDGSKDSCQGDSGGPLMVLNNTTQRYTLMGKH